MTDDEYRELQARAMGARALLDSDMWQAAFVATEQAVIAEWRNVPWTAPSLREQKYAEIKGLQAVRDRLQGWIDTAKFEAAAREKQRLRLV